MRYGLCLFPLWGMSGEYVNSLQDVQYMADAVTDSEAVNDISFDDRILMQVTCLNVLIV